MFNGSYRYSDYSTDVNTSTYGLASTGRSIDDVKLRGSFQHAVRAPNIYRAVHAAGLGLFDMSERSLRPGAPPPTARSRSASRAAWHPRPVRHSDLDSPAGQYNAIFGGNTDL